MNKTITRSLTALAIGLVTFSAYAVSTSECGTKTECAVNYFSDSAKTKLAGYEYYAFSSSAPSVSFGQITLYSTISHTKDC